jgi:peptidoglycan DL-endopeptidase CwlO
VGKEPRVTTPVLTAPAAVAQFQAAFAALSSGPDSPDFASLLASLTPTAASSSSATTAETTTGSPASTAVTGSAVVADAKKYLGIPYQWGGTSTTTGFDCSGLTQHVFADLGISIPRTAAEQQAMPGAQKVDSLADAQPGDLVFFGTPAHHVGIYVGNGQMLNAPHTGADVRIEPVFEKPSTILRVTGTAATAATSATGSTTAISSTLQVPSKYASTFLSAGAKYGISPTLLAAVAKAESDFNPNAVSPAGAIGIMQLMPGTAAGLGVDPRDPTQAINGAAKLLSGDISHFGSIALGLAAYNAGGGAVTKYGGIPPYPETEAYVTKVMSLAGLSS